MPYLERLLAEAREGLANSEANLRDVIERYDRLLEQHREQVRYLSEGVAELEEAIKALKVPA